MDYSPGGSSVHGIFTGKNSGVGWHFLFQGIFLTHGSNTHLLCLLYWQADSLPTSYQGNPLLLFSGPKSCPTLCNPINCSTIGFPVLHYLPEFTQTHIHCVGHIQPSHLLSSPAFSSCPHSFPASGSFLMNQLFASSGQSIGASASASVFPINI